MEISEFCFKASGTCVVILVALAIAGWIGLPGFWWLVATLGVVAGIFLTIGIIAYIWEN